MTEEKEEEEECKEYKPVCGVNYITYANKCECKAYNIKIAYYGVCKEKEETTTTTEEEDECKIYKPVCGVNYITYANKCQCYANHI